MSKVELLPKSLFSRVSTSTQRKPGITKTTINHSYFKSFQNIPHQMPLIFIDFLQKHATLQ